MLQIEMISFKMLDCTMARIDSICLTLGNTFSIYENWIISQVSYGEAIIVYTVLITFVLREASVHRCP